MILEKTLELHTYNGLRSNIKGVKLPSFNCCHKIVFIKLWLAPKHSTINHYFALVVN
jgi:hypothetical protein